MRFFDWAARNVHDAWSATDGSFHIFKSVQSTYNYMGQSSGSKAKRNAV